ncbi:MAG: hypothetical protein MJ113_04705 [Lachnospiraceae bacterium]|nr:hypothetical protein [Lachnospiraceae bacterium]
MGQDIKLLLSSEGESKIISLAVHGKELSEEEAEELFVKKQQEIYEMVLGDNLSTDEILYPLKFVKNVGDNVEADYLSLTPELVDEYGNVYNNDLTTPVRADIQVKLTKGNAYKIFFLYLTICPATSGKTSEKLEAAVDELTEYERNNRDNEIFVIPEEINGVSIEVMNEKITPLEFAFIALISALVLGYSLTGLLIEKEDKKRHSELEDAYSEFVSKLAFCVSAGLTVRNAVLRVISDYEKRLDKNKVLRKRLISLKQDMETGVFEASAYDHFGRTCDLPCYQRLANILSQSVVKGIKEVRNDLFDEAGNALLKENTRLRMKNEELGTKLLIPMFVFLIEVMLILIVPAMKMI